MKTKFICEKCGKEYDTKADCFNCELSHEEIKLLSKQELEDLNTKYKIELSKLQDMSDIEVAHACADDILTSLLLDLGFVKLVHMFNNLEKWYS